MREAVPTGEPLQQLSDRLGHSFGDLNLLELALTHRSVGIDAEISNERLEFLGDAVLGAAVSELLYTHFPDASEGRLTKLKSLIVNNSRLAEAARRTEIGPCLRLNKGEECSGGRTKPRLLANAFEAVVGAVYLDGGMEAVGEVVRRLLVGPDGLAEADELLDGAQGKSALQEWLQARGRDLPEYSLIESFGPSNRRTFRVEVRCGAEIATGEARRKQTAEQLAAGRVLRKLIALEAWDLRDTPSETVGR